MRRVGVVALVVLLGLSGCAALSGPARFAPGLTQAGVENASTLAAAHDAVLANTSYTFTRNASQRVEGGDYRYAVDHDTRVWVAADGHFRYRHRSVIENANGTSRRLDGVWANGSVAVMRAVDLDDGSVTYTRYRPPDPFTAADVARSGIASALRDAAVTETWNDSGTEFARLATNESETRRILAGNGTAVNATTRRHASATVRGDGFVPRVEWTISGQRPLPPAAGADRAIGRVRDGTRIRFTNLGSTTVDRPAWVDDALAATDDLAVGESSGPRSP